MKRGALLLLAVLAACRTGGPGAPPPGPPSAEVPPSPEAPPPTPPPVRHAGQVSVSAWAEPSHLPPGGGQAQILVRVRRPSGAPAPGVDVRLASSAGHLYSAGRVLKTGSSGMTRDRLTTRATAVVTIDAGGTSFRLTVPVERSTGG